MAKSRKSVWFLILIIAAVFIYFSSPLELFSIFQPSGFGVTNYNGGFYPEYSSGDSWIEGHPEPIDTGGTIKLFDYESKQVYEYASKTQNTYGDFACEANICNGVKTGTDEYGCDLFTGSENAGSHRLTVYRESGTTGYGRCAHETRDIGGQCVQASVIGGNGVDKYCGCSGNSVQMSVCTGDYRGTYDVVCSTKRIDYCGGWKQPILSTISGWYWWQKTSITKAGEVVYEDKDWTLVNRKSVRFDEGEITLTDYDVQFVMNTFLLSTPTSSRVTRIQNEVVWNIPQDKFAIEVVPSARQVFEDQEVTAEVRVNNSWAYDVKGNLIVTYIIPTAIGDKEQTVERIVDLPKGSSVHSFDIPTTLVTDTVRVKVALDVLAEGNNFAGLNTGYACYEENKGSLSNNKIKALRACDYVMLGSFAPEEFVIQVNPKPLYLVDRGDCRDDPDGVTGYICQNETGLYVRDDIADFTCFKIGCPVIEGKTYECTSAGICAETVFVYKDCTSEGCPEGLTCDANSGVCIRTEIFSEVVQCDESSDCPVPCSGMTASCNGVFNRCEYSGTCDPTIVQCLQDSDCPSPPCAGVTVECNADTTCAYVGECEPTYLNIDCSSTDCPVGYECDTSASPAVCKKDIYTELDCTSLGCPPLYNCQESAFGSNVCLKTETIYVERDCLSENVDCPQGYACIEISGDDGSYGVCENTAFILEDCTVKGCDSNAQCESDGVCYALGHTSSEIVCPTGTEYSLEVDACVNSTTLIDDVREGFPIFGNFNSQKALVIILVLVLFAVAASKYKKRKK